MKSILLIAPDVAGINTPLEADQIAAGHKVTLLSGVVSHDRITRATATARFNIIHVVSHCANSEIELSNGEVLTKDQLSQIARKTRSDLVFLNACDSSNFAQYLIDTGVPVVLAWTLPVLDVNGVRTASYYYDELLEQSADDYYAAYNKINPRDGSLSFLAGPGYVQGILTPIIQRIDQIGQQITSLVTVMGRQRISLAILALLVLLAIVAAAALVFLPISPITGSEIGSQATGAPAGAGDSVGERVPSGREAREPIKLTQTAEPQPTATFVPTVPPATEIPPPSATDTPVPATDTPVIDTPMLTDTPVIVTPKPQRTATDTPTRFPTWTKTPERPLAVTTIPMTPVRPTLALAGPTPLPGCVASGGQPKKCEPTPIASATTPAAALTATAASINATATTAAINRAVATTAASINATATAAANLRATATANFVATQAISLTRSATQQNTRSTPTAVATNSATPTTATTDNATATATATELVLEGTTTPTAAATDNATAPVLEGTAAATDNATATAAATDSATPTAAAADSATATATSRTPVQAGNLTDNPTATSTGQIIPPVIPTFDPNLFTPMPTATLLSTPTLALAGPIPPPTLAPCPTVASPP